MSETDKGEIVRSKAEKEVADYFNSENIDYIYEKTIVLGRKKHKIKYDFYLPQEDTYIEYWGLEKAEKEIREKYIERKEEKIHLYDKYNLKLVSLYPEDLSNLESIFPEKIAEAEKKNRSIWKKFMRWLKYALFMDDGLSHANESKSNISESNNNILIFCVKCGNQISMIDPFCTECGTKNELR